MFKKKVEKTKAKKKKEKKAEKQQLKKSFEKKVKKVVEHHELNPIIIDFLVILS